MAVVRALRVCVDARFLGTLAKYLISGSRGRCFVGRVLVMSFPLIARWPS
jgi:hypothetical protein